MKIQYIEEPFAPDSEALLSRMSLEADSEEAADFLALLDKMKKVTRPKAAYGQAEVEANDGVGAVRIGGVAFSGSVLAANLRDAKAVWPHIATCGREAYDFAQAIPDPFERYWCDEIMETALAQVRVALLRAIEREDSPGKVAVMGPGSLKEWPIEQQEPLFRLLGDAPGRCGLELTDTMLMVPNKSISGILFQNENGWESCVMCPREKCPNRRAEYNPDAMSALDA